MAQEAERTAVPEVVTDRAAPLTAAQTAGSPGAAAAADRRWWVPGVVGLGELMGVLVATIVSIALPSAQHDLGVSDAGRQGVRAGDSRAFVTVALLGLQLFA